jgi:creatinine amidohydrolase/Fe(II)-dependent formamide hydrolase-like protein
MDDIGHLRQGLRVFDRVTKILAGAKNYTWPSRNYLGAYEMAIRMINDLSWKDVDEMDRENVLVILPIGSVEQHGPHLPLGMDNKVAEGVLDAARAEIDPQHEILVLPTVGVGQSPEHMDFPGSITFRAETLIMVLKDICDSLTRHNFKKVLVLNGHGGNIAAIGAAAFDVRLSHKLLVFQFNVWAIVSGMDESIFKREANEKAECHGGELETSMMLAVDSSLVDMSLAVDEENPKLRKSNHVGMGGPVTVNWSAYEDHAKSGISGEPSFGSEAKGQAMLSSLSNMLAETVDEIMEVW